MGIMEETAALSADEGEIEFDEIGGDADTESDPDDAFSDGFDFDDDEDPDAWDSDGEDGEADELSEEQEQSEDAELHTIKVGGEEISLSYEELVAAAQQGQDYTRKTQQLAEERKQLATWASIAEAFDEDPAGVIRSLAAQFDVRLPGAPEHEDEDDLDLLDPMERELRELRAELADLRQERETEKLTRQEQDAVDEILAAVDQVGTKYGVEMDDDAAAELIQFAYDNNIANIEMAFLARERMTERSKPAPVERPASQRKRNLPPIEGGRPRSQTATRKGASNRFDSVEDAFEAALADHRGR